jgi:plasmid maintenance system antidote protein VapI
MSKALQTVQWEYDWKAIRRECLRRGWGQQELARHAGLSRPTVSVAIRGGLITPRTALKIQAAFDRTKPKLAGLVRETA